MEKTMKYTARFIGGPIDGQERLLNSVATTIKVRGSTAVYNLLFAYGEKQNLFYSVYVLDEALEKLWEHHHESVCRHHHQA
jgi:hypothetical protein